MRNKRRRSGYKFTEKTQSKRGIIACIIEAVSIGIFAYVVWNSFSHKGEGSMYLGSAGVASMILSVVGLVFATLSLREEDSFKLFPYLGFVLSLMAVGTWVGLYIWGFIR